MLKYLLLNFIFIKNICKYIYMSTYNMGTQHNNSIIILCVMQNFVWNVGTLPEILYEFTFK